jgi:hypothetical protein
VPFTSPSLLTPFLTGTGGPPVKVVLRSAYVAIDGVDVSALTHAIAVQQDRDAVDVTGYTSVTREYAPGLGGTTVTLALWLDNDRPLPDSLRTGGPVVVQTAARTPAPYFENPLFTAVCTVIGYRPLTGATGDAAGVEIDLVAGPVSSAVLTVSGTGDVIGGGPGHVFAVAARARSRSTTAAVFGSTASATVTVPASVAVADQPPPTISP